MASWWWLLVGLAFVGTVHALGGSTVHARWVLIVVGLAWYAPYGLGGGAHGLKCIVASRDGQEYCVRERPKMELAANKLAEVTDKMKQLVTYVKTHKPQDERTRLLVANFDPHVIRETTRQDTLHAYSENKGDRVAFCLNKHDSQNDGDRLVDLHTLTFVAIHELSHLATIQEDHPRVFWQNFKWLLENAKEAGIHAPVDYKHNPEEYCGMTIDDNPLYDLN